MHPLFCVIKILSIFHVTAADKVDFCVIEWYNAFAKEGEL